MIASDSAAQGRPHPRPALSTRLPVWGAAGIGVVSVQCRGKTNVLPFFTVTLALLRQESSSKKKKENAESSHCVSVSVSQ